MCKSLAKPVVLFSAVVALLTVVPRDLYGGPPLICHPLKIGDAKSLPFGQGKFETVPGYNREQVVNDTLSLLTPDMPLIVRMETLRRATIYASRSLEERGGYTDQDRRIAYDLLARLTARALDSDLQGKPQALAWFDAGYLVECYKQAGLIKGLDGYNWVKKSLALRPGDAEIEFACAVITRDSAAQSNHQAHLKKAAAKSQKSSLLSANLALHFGHRIKE